MAFAFDRKALTSWEADFFTSLLAMAFLSPEWRRHERYLMPSIWGHRAFDATDLRSINHLDEIIGFSWSVHNFSAAVSNHGRILGRVEASDCKTGPQ